MVDWKNVIVGATCLVGLAATAWASPERPVCTEWDEPWFHHLTTAGHIRSCIDGGQVDINRVDHEGRTLLHRIAKDLYWDSYRSSDYFEQPTRYESSEAYRADQERIEALRAKNTRRTDRRAMIDELLRWDQLDLDVVDHKGRTAWRYLIKRKKNWSTAAKLVKAGASMRLPARDAAKMRKHWTPIFEVVRDRISDVAGCATSACAVEELAQGSEEGTP